MPNYILNWKFLLPQIMSYLLHLTVPFRKLLKYLEFFIRSFINLKFVIKNSPNDRQSHTCMAFSGFCIYIRIFNWPSVIQLKSWDNRRLYKYYSIHWLLKIFNEKLWFILKIKNLWLVKSEKGPQKHFLILWFFLFILSLSHL